MKTVRQAEAADLPELLRLTPICPGAAPWSAAVWAEVLRSSQGESPWRCVFVVDEEEKLYGFAVLQGLDEVAEIENLAVEPAQRRAGLGQELCTRLLGWAAVHGATRVQLEVRAGNAVAQAFYAKLGFAYEGMRPRYYTRPVEDAVLMSVSLGPG